MTKPSRIWRRAPRRRSGRRRLGARPVSKASCPGSRPSPPRIWISCSSTMRCGPSLPLASSRGRSKPPSGTGRAPGTAMNDTVKQVDVDGRVVATPPRSALRAVQTPQAFRFPLILEAHRRAAAAGVDDLTDDVAVAEWAGAPAYVFEGDPANVKVTTMQDLEAAEARLTASLGETRVGQGFDVHAFAPGDHVWLCGLRIAHSAALAGHSDADVALHALADALYGALAEGDIGQHFPPSDPQWKGTTSKVFLAHAAERVRARGGVIVNLDVTLVCEAPKIGPHREAMRARVAEIARLDIGRVAVKATTSEKLGFTGRGEGIACLATATVRLP